MVGVSSFVDLTPYTLQAHFIDHDKSKHTNRTRAIFVPVTYSNGTLEDAGWLIDAAGEICSGYGIIPIDYVSGGIFKLVHKAKVIIGIFQINSNFFSAAHDEPYNTVTDTDAARTLPALSAVNDIGIQDVGIDPSGIAAGDEFHIKVTGAGAITADSWVQGWIFEYVADE
jgi:hypothetical protein